MTVQTIRRLLRTPWETSLAVVALALGLGVVAASYAVVDAVLLDPLPVRDAERVVALIQTRTDDGKQYTTSYPNADRWRRAASLEALAVSRPARWALVADDGTARRVGGHEVEPGFFDLLGLEPRLGHTFLAFAEERPGDVVLVSDGFWRTELGADPGVVGRTLRFAEGTRTVIGVLPPLPQISRLSLGDVWAPLWVDETTATMATTQPTLRGLRVHARLHDDASLASAQAELAAVAAAFAAERPETQEGWGVTVEPLGEYVLGSHRAPLLSLLAVASLVLLVAVATVGSLAVARALDRRGETAVRRALGAGTDDLTSAWLLEWTFVGVLGGVASLPLAHGTLRLLIRGLGDASGSPVALLDDASLAGGMFGILLVASTLAGLAAGLFGLPRLLARGGGLAGRGRRSATDSRAEGGLRAALVAFQTGLAVVALVAALLLGRSLAALGEVDVGFQPEGLLTFQLELPPGEADADKNTRREIWRGLLERLEAIPGVDSAAVTTSAPLTGYAGIFEVWIEGDGAAARSATPDHRTLAQIGSPGMIETAGILLLAGRGFEDGETWDARHAVLVNRAFVRSHLGAAASGNGDVASALGRRLRWQNGETGEIVGVVDDVREVALHLDAEPEIYMAWGAVSPRQTVLLRADGDVLSTIVPAVRRLVARELPGVPVHGVRTGRQLITGELAQRRLLTSLAGLFATLAQSLALLGLYGVVAGRLVRARRAIAIRMAVGARGADIRRWSLRTGLTPVLVGGVAGLAVAWAVSGLLRGQLYGVEPVDGLSYVAALALALAGSWLAASVPARRAARLDPARTLRETG